MKKLLADLALAATSLPLLIHLHRDQVVHMRPTIKVSTWLTRIGNADAARITMLSRL